MLLGHLVQIFHWLLVIAVAYLMFRKPWVSYVWFFVVVISQLITGGMCPLTILSNTLLEDTGSIGYPDLLNWFKSFIGMPASCLVLIVTIVIPMRIGYLYQKTYALTKSLQKPSHI